MLGGIDRLHSALDELVPPDARFEVLAEGFEWTEVSLGPFVLSGGEVAAMAAIEAATRLLPGVLGDEILHAAHHAADDQYFYCERFDAVPAICCVDNHQACR